MKLLERFLGRRTDKTLAELPAFKTWPESKSGPQITAGTALEVSAVIACARVIAEGVAQVPLKFYGPAGADGRRRPVDHELARTFGYRPNQWQTSFEFRETLMLHLILCGNAFVFVSRRSDGSVIELIPIEPARVFVNRRLDMVTEYSVMMENGRSPTLRAPDIWHIKGPSWSSWYGLEPVRLAREAIGLALATEESHARFHANGARPSGMISVDGNLDEKAYQRLKQYIESEVSGVRNTGKPLIADRAAKFQQFAMSGVDAQHLETRRFQIEEICRALRVMPIMIGHADKTATYASAEQMFLAHVVHTITPWCARIEQSAEHALLAADDDIDIRFDLKGLMRGAAADRAAYLSKALGAGGSPAWMTPNEAREMDGLDPIEGGDELPKPTNVSTNFGRGAASEGTGNAAD